MAGIEIMQDASEIVPYSTPGLPLYTSHGRLSHFHWRRMLCHWHDDLEWIAVYEGSMRYRIGKETVLLCEGDVLFVNSRQLHDGQPNKDDDCRYYCVLCHPDLLSANRILYSRFVQPIAENTGFAFLHLHAGDTDTAAIFSLLRNICAEDLTENPDYALEALGLLHILWRKLYPLCLSTTVAPRDYTDETLQKDMVSYIQKHYAEHITLADIAAAGHVCQNKCCVLFRRYLQQSPIDFLNTYRLEVSRRLLCATQESISDIALACGFNHLSYYSKLFQRKYGSTPSEWRRTNGTDGI